MIRSFIYTDDKQFENRIEYESKKVKSMNDDDVYVGESGFILIYHSEFVEIFYNSKIYMNSKILVSDFQSIMRLIKMNEKIYRVEKIKRLLC